MEKIFNQLCEGFFSELENDESLTLSFAGENSQFIRINNASIRQTGLVDDANLGLKFISNNRTCEGSITVSGDYDIDLFTQFFDGGKAFLKMVGSSDPLLSGLEVFASPPGKK